MRIGIFGAHGVGKTTLAEMLAKELDLPLIKEVARELIAEHGHPASMEPERALKFQQEVLERQMIEERWYSAFVSDRTVMDVLAYWVLYGLDFMFPGDFSKARKKVLQHIKEYRYDMLIYVPVEFPYPRSDALSCEGCRRLLSAWLISFVQQVVPRSTRLLTVGGAPEQRLKQALYFVTPQKERSS